MTAPAVICLFLGLAALAAAQKPADKDLPRISNPFELISLDSIYVKDGMKKIRHSRVRIASK
jgi:hypothetical protein